MTNEECTRIYNEANSIITKQPPLTTERIFTAMRAVRKIAMKNFIITVVATVVITTAFIAASTYVWLQTLPKLYTCQKTEAV